MKKSGWKHKRGGATPSQKEKVGKVMREFKEGELHVGKSEKVVKNPKQAIAIALSEAGLSKKELGGTSYSSSLNDPMIGGTMASSMAKGGVVKYYNEDDSYRLTPANSIEKEILEKVNYEFIRPYFAGNFGWKTPQGKLADGYLYNLDDYDQNLIGKLKENEKVYRYFNRTSAIGGMSPFIKINLDKGLLYFLIPNDNDDIIFETKGTKAQWINLIESKMEKGGGVDDVSESMAKQSLMKLKESGEISQLRVGVHGQVFMSIKGGQLKSYDNYKDAYAHYNKNKYAKGGGLVETVLWGVRKGEPDWAEEIITNKAERIEDAKKWALANGFDRLRVAKMDMTESPDFSKTIKAEGGGIKDSATVIVISQNNPLAKQIGTGWNDIYNSYGVSLVEKDGKKYIVFTYNYVSQVDRYVIKDDISYIMKTYGISNVEWDNLSDKRYALEMSKNEYADGGGVDNLNEEGENLIKYNKIEDDLRLKDNVRLIIVEIEKYKKYAKIVKKDGEVIDIKYAQNPLTLLLKNSNTRINKKLDGGNIEMEEIDLNELDMPVIRSQFEEEEFEYGGGGAIYSRTMKTPDGTIVGKVDYNDFWKTYQVIIDGVVYEEFKTKEEAINNLKNAGFDKMALGGNVNGNFYILLNDGSKKWYSESNITKIPNIYFASGYQDQSDEGVAFVHYDNALRPVYKSNGERADKMAQYAGMEGREIKADGGNLDLNDWDMPVIRSQFEEEDYEFEKGGEITPEERKKSLKNNLKLKL